ncbi:hypothetical protein MP228_007444 [Amoeboaphelidium protococcarum]|nr:hypothetical protein MP228_007444 [Amoeboaphelidium protococcarum]
MAKRRGQSQLTEDLDSQSILDEQEQENLIKLMHSRNVRDQRRHKAILSSLSILAAVIYPILGWIKLINKPVMFFGFTSLMFNALILHPSVGKSPSYTRIMRYFSDSTILSLLAYSFMTAVAYWATAKNQHSDPVAGQILSLLPLAMTLLMNIIATNVMKQVDEQVEGLASLQYRMKGA